MLDEVIKGGTVVDGTGAPGVRRRRRHPRRPHRRRSAQIDEAADARHRRHRAASSRPGFVDPHTHYDAQLLWDPTASPSSVHGVTTVIGGNCGFTLAPLRAGDADYLRRMMAKVEGMPLPALEQGIDWKWETFAEYLDRFEGNIAVNAGLPRRPLRDPPLRDGCRRDRQRGHARADRAMRAELGRALEAGALGFSFTQSTSHSDGDGQPVASRWATPDELVAMSEETGAHAGTTLEGIVQGCLDQFSDDEIELLGTMSARRPTVR